VQDKGKKRLRGNEVPVRAVNVGAGAEVRGPAAGAHPWLGRRGTEYGRAGERVPPTARSHAASSFIGPRRACTMASVEGDFLLQAHSASRKILTVARCHCSPLSLATRTAQRLVAALGSPVRRAVRTPGAFCCHSLASVAKFGVRSSKAPATSGCWNSSFPSRPPPGQGEKATSFHTHPTSQNCFLHPAVTLPSKAGADSFWPDLGYRLKQKPQVLTGLADPHWTPSTVAQPFSPWGPSTGRHRARRQHKSRALSVVQHAELPELGSSLTLGSLTPAISIQQGRGRGSLGWKEKCGSFSVRSNLISEHCSTTQPRAAPTQGAWVRDASPAHAANPGRQAATGTHLLPPAPAARRDRVPLASGSRREWL